ncbi:MAG: type II secretion system protein [candidate division WOR-3 bacterium]|nr:MAG: type II secretion system protein [candidate division WOR-3 bacterium]
MKNKGFTLIELMVVVVIIGILAAIAIPNFISMQKRAKEASVKNNMHTLQLAAEDFSTLTEGIYAVDCAEQVGTITGVLGDLRSIAGAATWNWPPAPANVLLPTSFKNPVATANREGDIGPAAYAAAADAGVVFYESFDATGASPAPAGTAVRYIITGNGVDAVKALTLQSGQ